MQHFPGHAYIGLHVCSIFLVISYIGLHVCSISLVIAYIGLDVYSISLVISCIGVHICGISLSLHTLIAMFPVFPCYYLHRLPCTQYFPDHT